MGGASSAQCQALDGKEKAWSPDHTSTLDTVNNLGTLYADQGKYTEVEQMYRRAIDGYKKAWGSNHPSTLRTLNNLQVLNANRIEQTKVEGIHPRALNRSWVCIRPWPTFICPPSTILPSGHIPLILLQETLNNPVPNLHAENLHIFQSRFSSNRPL